MDPAARRFMWKVVSNITVERPKSCVILTTHSMEEADALATRMGILVHGGLFKCMGTSQQIKDKFGSGYEMEFKLNEPSYNQTQRMLRLLSLDKKESLMSLTEFTSIAVPPNQHADF